MAVGTTRGKRRLGRFVKPIRLRAGLKPEDVATRARCSRQTVTRLEAGENLPRIHLFSAILVAIEAAEDERQQALALWDVADVDISVIEHAEELPANYRRFRMDENEAVLERTRDTVIVPGLLQTPEYAVAVSRGARGLLTSEDWEDYAADERRERQALLTREHDPLELHALVAEAALWLHVGGRGVLVDQLDHLLEIAEWPNITVRIVPFRLGAYGAMGGPWYLLSFPEPDEDDSAYVESVTHMRHIDDSAVVDGLATMWRTVSEAAPSPERSADIIRSVRDEVSKRE